MSRAVHTEQKENSSQGPLGTEQRENSWHRTVVTEQRQGEVHTEQKTEQLVQNRGREQFTQNSWQRRIRQGAVHMEQIQNCWQRTEADVLAHNRERRIGTEQRQNIWHTEQLAQSKE